LKRFPSLRATYPFRASTPLPSPPDPRSAPPFFQRGWSEVPLLFFPPPTNNAPFFPFRSWIFWREEFLLFPPFFSPTARGSFFSPGSERTISGFSLRPPFSSSSFFLFHARKASSEPFFPLARARELFQMNHSPAFFCAWIPSPLAFSGNRFLSSSSPDPAPSLLH